MTIEELIDEKTKLEKLVIQLAGENQQLKDKLSAKKASDTPFADLLETWLRNKKMSVKANTYEAYCTQVNHHLVPYFRSKGTMLSQLTPAVLEEYYFTKLQSGLSGSTIRKHHSNIKMALKFAVKNGLTDQNAALLAELPSCNKFCGNFLNTEQFDLVLSKIKHTAIYTPVFIAGTMGLRRSEVLGLRWSDINFEQRTMCIQHTVVKCVKNHKTTLIFSDVPKTRSSRRTLPLPDSVYSYLKWLKHKQCLSYAANRSSYSRQYLQYICVDSKGILIQPDELSVRYIRLMNEMHLRCRFHDLRHPYVKPTTKKFLSFFKFEMAISLRAFLCFALLLGIKEGPQLVPFIR